MIYEFPLSEGVRRLLRAEMLFKQSQSHIEYDNPFSTIAALSALVDLVEVISKNNLKIEMIKQLDRLQYKEEISDAQRQEMKELSQDLVFGSVKAFDEVKENIFLNVVRQRLKMTGGLGAFDLPNLHHWLRFEHGLRLEHMDRWFKQFAPTEKALNYVLSMLRALSDQEVCQFKQGLFYKTVKWDAELVRLDMGDKMIYPEFSGNKQQLSIRLMEQTSPFDPVTQVKEDLEMVVERCG
ncbi:cell division protein ZapD [Wohlfahrtiimonas chitiniclastica]|uniref:cell division protein ZapD n=1 Tax=Wohlfahrtiimonas chitiniclastica TaxID=400946 RepID=UPI000B993DA9|nr:cell division protein ZapD [Wohlfahrtiimonas chitiniclastica]OYQ74236.1 cell division protein ZapD [Wohlfahrtiimonas chitiniclastica]